MVNFWGVSRWCGNWLQSCDKGTDVKNLFYFSVFVMTVLLPLTAQCQINIKASADAPIYAEFHKHSPYELKPMTFISLTLVATGDDDASIITASVNDNVYDEFGNVAIGKGSQVLGKHIQQVNARHRVFWTDIRLAPSGQVLHLDPPVNATQPDGSSGIVDFRRGGRVGGLLSDFLRIPH